MNYFDHFIFGIYPYIALSVFLLGSLIRFDRDQYSWKSDSSQLLRRGQLRWGSNLFHVGVLFLFGGHSVGMSIFFIFPFTRLVHVWSGFGTLGYVVRPYQVVRSRRVGMTPRSPFGRS